MYPISNEAAEERAYRAGQLHVTQRLPGTKIDFYRQRHPTHLQQKALLHCTYVTFNTKRPPFNDARVRRAFSLAIDRAQIVSRIFHGGAQAARSLTRPGMGGLEPPAWVYYAADEAQRCLSEAGFPGGLGFSAVEFRFIASSPDIAAMAESLQQMWQQTLGVRVSLQQMEGKAYGAALAAHDYQFGTLGFYTSIDDPEQLLQIAGQGCSFNYANWTEPRYEAGFAAACNAATDAERLAAFDAMERILAEEVPYAPLLHWNSTYLVHPSVRGWRSKQFGRVDWRELWLEESQ
jgi:oligopeptide transport system substrate-binding protein